MTNRTRLGGEQIPLGEIVRIHFRVDPPVGGIRGETLWGEKVGDRRYRVRNIPCYVSGVNENDIVFADRRRGVLTFTGTSLRSGHSTYRVLNARDLDPALFSRHWEPLKRLGCSYEGDGRGFLAVDVPPHADIRAVRELLHEGKRAGVWIFEEASSN